MENYVMVSELVIRGIIMVVSFIFCYFYARKNNLSDYYTFLGFFGIIGIIALLLIVAFGNNHSEQIQNNGYNSNGYKGQDYQQNHHNNIHNQSTSYYDKQQSGAQFKYCPKCGAKMEGLTLFCSYCGTKFDK